MRRTLPRLAATVAALTLALHVTIAPAAAEEELASMALAGVSFAVVEPAPSPAFLGTPVVFPSSPAPASTEQMRPIVPVRPAADFSRIRRPSLLPALYAGNVALQALDAHSTLTALGQGAREANPVMRGVVGNRTALLAVKAGAAAGTIYFAEKLWRRNRAGAVAMMIAVNGVSAAVVAHNYKVARQLE